MAKLNRSLVVSIIEDIRELVRVGKEMYSCLDKIQHLSWRFPTKVAKDINAIEMLEQHEGSAGEFYILLLELAYDRMHFLLRLILDFMDKYPFTEDSSFKEVANVKRPNYMSLAHVVGLVWKRLKTIAQSTSQCSVAKRGEQKEQRGNAETIKVCQHVQTSITDLRCCASCAIARESIVDVTNAIEAHFRENKLISTSTEEREKLSKGDIYERTEWSVMRRLTRAIEIDVQATFRMMRDSDMKRKAIKRNYEETVDSLKLEFTRKEADVSDLRMENTSLRKAIDIVNQRLREMEENCAQLQRSNELLSKNYEHSCRRRELLTESNSILQSQIAILAENKFELEASVRGVRAEIKETRDACHQKERDLRKLLTELQKENDCMKAEYEGKIDKLTRELTELRDELQKSRESAEKSCAREEEMEVVSGSDPEADMTRQYVSNRKKIELLSRQNERLAKTLSRLKELRLTTARTAK